MKKFILAAYIFFCTGGTYAQTFCAHAVHNCQCNPQQRESKVVAEIDFNKPAGFYRFQHGENDSTFVRKWVNVQPDTIRATLLVTRDRMRYAFSYEGYAVFRDIPGKWILKGDTLAPAKDTVYLDDRKRPLKRPVTVWSFQPLKIKDNGTSKY